MQKIPGLRVAARTSAFSFKGKRATAQEIGEKLGVAHLVEGSVRKAGDTVRIAARLTNTASGNETWSENYTRNLKDIFAVQTELAETIVGQLRAQLSGNSADSKSREAIQAQVEAAEQGGTRNLEAHQNYLLGRFHIGRHSEKAAREALQDFQRAVELDPNYVLAWAGLAETHAWMCAYSAAIDRPLFDQHLAAANEAVNRALTIAPDFPEALGIRGGMQLAFYFDWKSADETLRRGLALAPNNVSLVTQSGALAFAKGNPDEATALYRRAVELDPLDQAARSYLALQLAYEGKLAEAKAEYVRVVELNPSAPWAHAGLGLAYLVNGQFAEAIAATEQESADWARLLIVAMARWGQKRPAESDAALAELKNNFGDTAAYQVAEVHAYRGEKDQAFAWLERAFQQRDPGLQSTRSDKLLASLHDDLRWPAFLEKMGMAADK